MKKIEEVLLLYEISKTLHVTLDLKRTLYKVLDILSKSMDMVRGTVSILNPVRNEFSYATMESFTAIICRPRSKQQKSLTHFRGDRWKTLWLIWKGR